ncbi:MAG TPA: leucyl aminopeptidase family protein [Steroidobacteraceae bacterium]|jgi:leucyl aminopeptidase|nr:leucyl aminopeptidase family protein [Steroidobacteraceae bacterium]
MHRLVGGIPGEKAPAAAAAAMSLRLVTESDWGAVRAALPAHQVRWAESQGFNGQRHRLLALPESDGSLAGALWGLGDLAEPDALIAWDAAPLSERLPAGTYALTTPLRAAVATQFCLGWLLGSYRFDRLRSSGPRPAPDAALVAPEGADLRYAEAAAAAMSWTRDLINTPANQMGPLELEAAARELAQQGAEITVISGAQLQREFPLIAAVGGGSHRPPRLIDCRWRRPGAPRVTLVGKGVCFDSGGLDLKSSSAMLLMKKDMGGAACVLGLARLLQQLETPVELRVLIPAVENSVGGSAYRPGDVWPSRKGLRVEIGNTDAEGRLVLADALAEADADQPELLIDLATLTGAARTALGPDLPAVFSPDESLARRLAALGSEHADPLWPMPLWKPYDEELSSRVGDLNNVSASAFAGAIIAALFLQRFVSSSTRWLHVDLFAWNPKERPGRPHGAEAQCVRALYQLIRSLYG